jgi:hypothetical protein
MIHSGYLRECGPVTRISKADSKIAISGKFGFCLYFQISQKWKLFVSHHLEKEFTVYDMFWHETYLVVTVRDHGQCEDQLRVYSTEDRLDESSLVHRVKLLSRPILLAPSEKDVHSHEFTIYSEDNQLCFYSLFGYEGSLALKARFRADLSYAIKDPKSITDLKSIGNDWVIVNAIGYTSLVHRTKKIVIPLSSSSYSLKVVRFENMVILFIFTRYSIKVRNK